MTPPSALRGRIKYVHARMPGRELVHLIAPDGLELDERFASDESQIFVTGKTRALCGRWSRNWIVGAGGKPCRECASKR